MQGFLEKKKARGIKGYNQKYVKVKNRMPKYWEVKGKNEKHHYRVINFDLYECAVTLDWEQSTTPSQFIISITGCDK